MEVKQYLTDEGDLKQYIIIYFVVDCKNSEEYNPTTTFITLTSLQYPLTNSSLHPLRRFIFITVCRLTN